MRLYEFISVFRLTLSLIYIINTLIISKIVINKEKVSNEYANKSKQRMKQRFADFVEPIKSGIDYASDYWCENKGPLYLDIELIRYQLSVVNDREHVIA